MCEKLIPGTKIPYDSETGSFEYFVPLIRVTDGLTLSQVCTVTGLEPSTIQNWVKREFLPRPVNKKYYERHLARILLINSMRDGMKIDRVGELFKLINGNTEDESDDIISEVRLFDIFCSIVSKLSSDVYDDSIVRKTVRSQTHNGDVIDLDALLRLRQALTVMVYAYTAGCYKKKCEEEFSKLP